MRELIGPCDDCGKLIFCESGFLNGNITDQKTLLCFDCFEKGENPTAENDPANGPAQIPSE